MHINFSVCLCIIMPHEHLTCSLPWNFFKSYSLFHVCKILPIRGTTTKMSILSHLSLSFMLRSIQLRVIKLCSHCVRGVEKCSYVCPNVSRRRWCHCYHSCDMCRHLPITHWLCSFCFFFIIWWMRIDLLLLIDLTHISYNTGEAEHFEVSLLAIHTCPLQIICLNGF